jgi:hypothetical protein
MRDRRKEQRFPAYLGGRITFSKRFAVADCLVRNTSATGARLVLHNGAFIPDEFDLSIPHRQADYRVRARWRSIDAIGVEITTHAAAPAPVPLSLARRMKRLESENAVLKRRLREDGV